MVGVFVGSQSPTVETIHSSRDVYFGATRWNVLMIKRMVIIRGAH